MALTITAFRGSTGTLRIGFDKAKTLVLVYGENGTGKTTICDAFEFLGRGEIASLKERGIGSGLSKYWPSVGKTAGDVVVTLETEETSCVGTISSTRAVVAPEDHRPRVEILRRKMLLDLIEATAGERYKAIKRFIDIEAFEASEETLRKLLTTLASEKQNAEAAELQCLGVLRSHYEAAGSPAGVNPVSWAREELRKPSADRKQEIAELGALRNIFEALKPLAARVSSANAAVDHARSELDAAVAAQLAARASANKAGEAALALLEHGRAYLQSHPDADACPLCESDEKAAGLAARIDERLSALKELSDARQRWVRCTDALAAAEDEQERLTQNIGAAAARFRTELSRHESRPEVAPPPTPLTDDPGALEAWLTTCAATAESWAAREASWRDSGRFTATLRDAIETYEGGRERIEELAALEPRVRQALDICMTERRAFVDQILSDIAKTVGELYEQVHRGEGLDKIAMPLDPKQRASLTLQTDFHGNDVPPQAYFSQSHLDTLGLCVFLALALREKPEETILILDDVLGSVDEPHVERLMEMIQGLGGRFRKMIVTTHYRPFRERLRLGMLPQNEWNFIDLKPWNLAGGIRVVGSRTEIEWLRGYLDAEVVDVQAAVGKAGVILEQLLDHLTLAYECRLPRRSGRGYTLSELLGAVGGKLGSALEVEVRTGRDDAKPKVVALKPHLDEIRRLAQLRNLMGAHFNELALHFQGADGVAFAEEAMKLADLLVCPKHGLPTSQRSGSHWANSGDTRRMRPLKLPG